MTKQELRKNLQDEIEHVLNRVVSDTGGSLLDYSPESDVLDILSAIDEYLRFITLITK